MIFDDPITDCDDLTLDIEVNIDPLTYCIDLNLNQGNMTVDGVTVQALYSFLKQIWVNTPGMMRHPFPISFQVVGHSIHFSFEDKWHLSDAVSYSLLRHEQKFVKLRNI